MAEMILPGVYIEVHPEGLIVPGRITVGNMGVIGTASKGPIGEPVLLSSYGDATSNFGAYDPWIDGASDELTLVRALEIAYNHGAMAVHAVRVASSAAKAAHYTLASAGGSCVVLTAKSTGTWGDDLEVNVWDAQAPASIEDETHAGGAAITLAHTTIIKNPRTRVHVFRSGTGLTSSLRVSYDDDPNPIAAGGVRINRTTGGLSFFAGEDPASGDTVTASYFVAPASAVQVTVRLGRAEEVYTVVNGTDLIGDITERSAWVDATDGDHPDELPKKSPTKQGFAAFAGGDNGESGADYQTGLDALLNKDAHIIVAAGQDNSFGDELDAHCQQASTDLIMRDRIAVVGSAAGATLDSILSFTLDSDRVIFAVPGIRVNDRAATPPVEVALPGAYTAAAIGGMLAGLEPHISLTNKTLHVGGLTQEFNPAQLIELVQNRILALESRQGVRVVRGITTSTNTAWTQITTRRIVDYAKFGVRSAASPYIGLLNNERVRAALKATINSFLAGMIDDEMLTKYDLDVSATRAQELQGIVLVTIVLQPVFSIDYIQVKMFLQ